MAQHQRKIKPALKRELYEQAGKKCANPGCTNWRVHIHHIKHWAVYKCHNAEDMIAICPSCHDAAHHGNLKITDEALYIWKGIDREGAPEVVHLFVEPAKELKLLTGSIAVATTGDQAIVFNLSNQNQLRLRVLDNDLLQVTSKLYNQKGKEVLRVIENNVRVFRDRNIKFDFRPGRARILVPNSDVFIPRWVVQLMREEDPTYGIGSHVVALDLEVIKPGLVRVEGFWPASEGAVVITQKSLSFCRHGYQRPLSLIGDGEHSVLMYTGPITTGMFGFA